MNKIVRDILKKILPPGVIRILKNQIRKISCKNKSNLAHAWADSFPGEKSNPRTTDISSCDSSNPLRHYFDSHVTGKMILKWLHYFDIYHHYFKKFIGKEVHIVEVGIYAGGSLDMWKSYFGPQCKIYGIDIHEECRKFEDNTTKVFIGDQGDRDFWKRFKEQVPNVDIIIDDGSHQSEHQIITLKEMLPHINPGGIYLCEDVHGMHNPFTAYVYGLTDNLQNYYEGVPSAFQKYIHSIHAYPFVTVIEKTDIPVDKFFTREQGTQGPPF